MQTTPQDPEEEEEEEAKRMFVSKVLDQNKELCIVCVYFFFNPKEFGKFWLGQPSIFTFFFIVLNLSPLLDSLN